MRRLPHPRASETWQVFRNYLSYSNRNSKMVDAMLRELASWPRFKGVREREDSEAAAVAAAAASRAAAMRHARFGGALMGL